MQAGAKIGTASGWSLLHLAVALQSTEALTLLAGKADNVNGECRDLHANSKLEVIWTRILCDDSLMASTCALRFFFGKL